LRIQDIAVHCSGFFPEAFSFSSRFQKNGLELTAAGKLLLMTESIDTPAIKGPVSIAQLNYYYCARAKETANATPGNFT